MPVMGAPAGAGHESGPTYYEEWAREQLMRDLDSLFRAALPHQWIDPAIKAALSDASPLVTPQAHTAAVQREVDWQRHTAERAQRAELEVGKLRAALDRTAADRVAAVLRLTADVYPSRTAKHGDDCHLRHAPCLAAMVRRALLGSDDD